MKGRDAELPAMRVLGLMSGTSLDGVDAVLARLHWQRGELSWEVQERSSAPYSPELRERLLQAIKVDSSDVVLLTQLHAEVGRVYAELAAQVQAGQPLDLIALSGQTVYHIPRRDEARGWRTVSTLQLGEAALSAERCRVPVLTDFRQADLAAGGQGAPMVAFGDLLLYHRPGVARAVHNLGGISNLTYLPADGDAERVLAFDTGPGNCLLDEAASRHFGIPCDEGGRLAAAGRVDEELLERLLTHPYFRLYPPKTTGRETFSYQTLARELEVAGLDPRAIIATLTALTAESVARAYRDFVLPLGVDEVLAAGGGTRNDTLMAMLRGRLPVAIRSFDQLGWRAKDREALAFAVLGYFAYHRRVNTLPRATGARHPVVAGKLCLPPPGSPRQYRREQK